MSNADTLNISTILESLEKCKQYTRPSDFNLWGERRTLLGMDIIEAHEKIVPVIKLRDGVQVTDKFRNEFNAWLLDMFGTRDESLCKLGTAYVFGSNVVMRRDDILKLHMLA